ncbi:phage tail sheath gpL-like [Bradyrhizobium japonicum]|uniref:Phage tail sheath subtilisin-like domain-containing protein n=1 Tax=Bradyrhizobium barranii subsp. barranii TaxID=2823807 RepID=A0A7Z0QG31_9BRAD|nr:phage tail sheath C-terminal domain-containing protein [Bradyrhizobium barranii]UGX90310.1 phage tail sheath subtilisin-like domain-containing protein [Bradyrhizobium barranii subsp. barranii]
MPISFNDIPANWRMPLYWVEVDPSKAGSLTQRQPALLIGYMLPGGVATVDVPVPIGSVAEAQQGAGLGSMLDGMAQTFFQNSASQEVWMLPIAEPATGVAATGPITVTSAPTQAGTIYVYIAGRRVPVHIDAEDTMDIVAQSIADAIGADISMPVTAATAAAVVTLTARHKGIEGNDITMAINYGGSLAGETMPAGLAIDIGTGQLAGGTGVPDLTAAISALGDEIYDYVAFPFTDSTSLDAIDMEYGFSDNGRWGWMRELYGHVFGARRGTYADLLQWGPNNNSGVISVMSMEPAMPSPPWNVAAAYAAKAGRALINDPARPLQTLELTGILSPPKHQRFLLSECNALAGVGLATQGVGANNVPAIRRETTTYQKNLYDQPDDAYELVTTLATLSALLRRQKQAITSKYPRHKLADDGTRFGPGQAIVTPKIVKAELVAQYRQDEFEGLVENAKAFKDNLIVERDTTNPNRLNVLYPPDLINQLRIFAVLAQFRLQYDRGYDASVL